MSTKFETERLELRTMVLQDASYALSFWGDEEVMKYCGGFAANEEQIKRSIEAYRNLEKQKGFCAYSVVLKENKEVIGICGFNPTEKDNEIELLYHFAKKYWGKGYATEAARGCINYAKENFNINKIIASVDPEHNDSKKILEKLGFEFICMKWFKETQQEEPYYELVIG